MTVSAKLEPFKLNTPGPAAYLVRDFVSTADENHILARLEQLAGSEEIGSTDGANTTAYRSKPSPKAWKTIGGAMPRRSMTFGGSIVGRSLIPDNAGLPDFLRWTILDRLRELGVFEDAPKPEPNHCLVNEYLGGQGLMPHEDGSWRWTTLLTTTGAAYWPRVATVSLGGHTVLDLYEYSEEAVEGKPRAVRSVPTTSILMPPRSLFILTDDLYSKWLHGIAPREVDTADQLSSCVNWSMADATSGDGPDVTEATGWTRSRRVSLTLRVVERVRRLL